MLDFDSVGRMKTLLSLSLLFFLSVSYISACLKCVCGVVCGVYFRLFVCLSSVYIWFFLSAVEIIEIELYIVGLMQNGGECDNRSSNKTVR